MDAGPGHFGMSNSNPNYGYGAQRYNNGSNGRNNTMPQRRGAPRPMGQNNSQKKDPNKSINAVEVKSYLNAWSTKQKLKPIYEYVQEGTTPQIRYHCTLTVGEYDCRGQGTAKSKKEAQTIAAWDMAEKLSSKGLLNLAKVPPIPENLLNAHNNKCAFGTLQTETKDNTFVEFGDEYGGWTTETARQRLNRFTMAMGIDCNIINHVTGPPHQRVTSASLSLIIEKLNNKVLQVQVDAPNKKTANSRCSMEMLKHLIANNLVERRGEPELKIMRKRKNEVSWTKATASNALKKFKDENVNDPTFGISESSAFKNGEFTISTVINCKGLKIEAQSSEASEDEAKSAVSVILAYKLTAAGLIETNSPPPKIKKTKEEYLANIRQTNIVMVPRYNNNSGNAKNWRNTPTADRQIKKKLCDLEQKESYKRVRVNVMNKIAKTIKESKNYAKIEDMHRIGEFFKGLELADAPEDHELVVVSKEKPTSFLVNEILEVLSELQEYTTTRYGDYLYVQKRPTETSNEGDEVAVYITFTSAAFYPPDGTEECADPEEMLPRQSCVDVWIRLQRALFVQDRCPKLFNSLAVLRIMKYLSRDPEMDGFNGWLMELFIIRCFETASTSEPAGDALRRVCSILSGGLLLPNVSSLIDLNGTDDLLDQLTINQRHSITAKAHAYLRLQVFKQLHVLLGIEFVEKKSSSKIEEPKPNFEETESSKTE